MNSKIAVLIFVIAAVLLGLSVSHPSTLIFDEQFYVPAARSFLQGTGDSNYQHPPLAKELMALSLFAVGDSAWGWRLGSVLAGAAALAAVYFLAGFFFENVFSLAAVLLVFTNGLFFTLSRLAMLEVFWLSLSLWGLVFFLRGGKHTWVAGALLGLALAAKWAALIPLLICAGLFCLSPQRKFKTGGVFLFSLLIFYVLPFVGSLTPFHWDSFLQAQANMWHFHRPDQLLPNLSYEGTSPWWQWPWQLQPEWLAILPTTPPNPSHFLGVMIFNNPVISIAGWIGLLILLKELVQKRTKASCVLISLVLVPWLFWALAQRPVTYFYYYLPSSVFLSLTAVYGLQKIPAKHRRWALSSVCALAVVVFLYHWPLLMGFELSRGEFDSLYPYFRLLGD